MLGTAHSSVYGTLSHGGAKREAQTNIVINLGVRLGDTTRVQLSTGSKLYGSTNNPTDSRSELALKSRRCFKTIPDGGDRWNRGASSKAWCQSRACWSHQLSSIAAVLSVSDVQPADAICSRFVQLCERLKGMHGNFVKFIFPVMFFFRTP